MSAARLTPPEGEPVLETADGLKYWYVSHMPSRGRQASVLTEDPKIAMHVYGGGRDHGPTYMLEHHGCRMGFLSHEITAGGLPGQELPVEKNREELTFCSTVTALGSPVFDIDLYTRQRADAAGQGSEPQSPGFVTGLSWSDYNAGQRDRFPDEKTQAKMLRILPDLYNGMRGNFRAMRTRGVSDVARMKFSDAVLAEIENGTLINE